MVRVLIPLCLVLLSSLTAVAGDVAWPELKNWKATAVERFDEKTVFKAINGAADTFFRFGFSSLTMRNYTRGDKTLELQLYEMKDDLGAFGVYSLEQAGGGKQVDVASQHLCSPPFLAALRKGPYYLKVGALQGKLDEADCRQVLAAMDGALPGSGKLPKAFDLLPAQGRVAGSEFYARESFLGAEDLSDCRGARYKSSLGEYRLFHMPRGKPGKKWKAAAGAAELLARQIPYEGQVFLLKKGDAFWGLAGLKDGAAAAKILRGAAGS